MSGFYRDIPGVFETDRNLVSAIKLGKRDIIQLSKQQNIYTRIINTHGEMS